MLSNYDTSTKLFSVRIMKTLTSTLIIAILLLLITYVRPCFAQTTASGASVTVAATPMYSLTVVLSDVTKRTGKIRVGLVNSAGNFDSESYQTRIVDVPASGEIAVSFDSLAAGRYAVRLFQDLNGNQKMDFNGQMPTEPFGFSNVTMLMGPPNFGQCAFDLAENKRIQVSLIEM